VYDALSRLAIDREHLPEPTRSFVQPEAERLIAELEAPGTTHYRRAWIGDRLDVIGDPRPGVGLRADRVPDIVWCAIPGGDLRLDGVEGALQVEWFSMPKYPLTRRVQVDPFFMAKYPVTYQQYRAFLDDPDGYRNRRWWEGVKRERERGEQYRPISNHPADNVSWYAAMAFCCWLGARLGYEVRLPTEQQWQHAATGGKPNNAYPWGEWAERRANTAESRLSRTTAVGMYPGGESAQRVSDLSGNVREWCLNKYEELGDTDTRREVDRVVRGGSWDLDRDFARCVDRFSDPPGHRHNNIGFRVVCSSPIL
jgi:formylglycine-generating enzyme required for sulfatase activity